MIRWQQHKIIQYTKMANTVKFGAGNWAGNNDSILAYNDQDGNFKPIPFVVTRNSVGSFVNKQKMVQRAGLKTGRVSYANNTNGAYLIESNATNIIPNSDAGTYGNGPGSETNVESPDGTITAVRPVPNSSSDRYQYAIPANTYATGTVLIYSWYRKRFSVPVNTYPGDLYQNGLINMGSGTTTQIESDINGYDRFQVNTSITDGAVASIYRMYFGYVIGVGNSSIAYWGQQLEVSTGTPKVATSLIYTDGAAASRVTESSTAVDTRPNIQGDWSIYFSFGKTQKDGGGSTSFLQINTSGDNLYLYTNSSGTDGLNPYFNGSNGGYIFGANQNNAWSTSESKVCLTFDSSTNRVAYFINGVLYLAVTRALVFGTTTNTSMQSGGNMVNVRDYKFYDETLTDSKSMALTTI